jgi:quercetin 2,3-dioxygenase
MKKNQKNETFSPKYLYIQIVFNNFVLLFMIAQQKTTIETMKRKDFLRRTVFGLGLAGLTPTLLAKSAENDETELPFVATKDNNINNFEAVGFEHLPPTINETKMNKIMGSFVLHKADSRGFADHGWLRARHTFSFANYYHPERVHFGALRVLNDDEVAGGRGFGMHPHQNMEIVTIPLIGDLEHKDSMGNGEVIRQGDVQIMSAGTGVQHSEVNPLSSWTSLLQIWILPDKQNIAPRYDQKTFGLAGRKNKLQLVVSPTHKEAMWINQNAFISLGHYDKGISTTYDLYSPKTNGVYIFVINGDVQIGTQVLNKRDAIGVWDVAAVDIKPLSESAEFVLLEVPM